MQEQAPQTRESINAELAKLSPSQRSAMRRQASSGNIDHLRVTKVGHKVKVSVLIEGSRHFVTLGPRGALISREVF